MQFHRKNDGRCQMLRFKSGVIAFFTQYYHGVMLFIDCGNQKSYYRIEHFHPRTSCHSMLFACVISWECWECHAFKLEVNNFLCYYSQ